VAYLETPLQRKIIELLNTDALLTSAFFGGIYPRLPRAGKGATATPNAFYTDAENPLQSGKLKPTIAVLDGDDVPAPAGEVLGGYQSFPWVYAYVIPDVTGETALGHLERVLRTKFRRDLSYPVYDVTGTQIIVLNRSGLLDGEDVGYPDRLWTRWRLQALSIRVLSQL